MTFGDLSNNQLIDRETRTAYFLGALGSNAQSVFGVATLSSHKCYKLLANLIWEWHFLSKNYPRRFAFPGIGDFVWTPHLYGSLGKVAPLMREPDFPLEHGLFASLSSLTEVGTYVSYGLLEPIVVSGRVELRFAAFMPYEMKRQSLVQENERHYWDLLTTVYSRCSDDELNALASCRTPAATVESLTIQLIRWRHHMSEALRGVVGGRGATSEIMAHFQQARFCIHQFFVKREFWLKADDYAQRLTDYAQSTELGDVLPQRHDLDELQNTSRTELKTLLLHADDVHALHFVCRQVHKKVTDEERDPRRMEETLERLATFMGMIGDELFDPPVWHSLFLGGDNKALATRALQLIDLFFARFAVVFDRTILDQTTYYHDLIRGRYLLPRTHFERGF